MCNSSKYDWNWIPNSIKYLNEWKTEVERPRLQNVCLEKFHFRCINAQHSALSILLQLYANCKDMIFDSLNGCTFHQIFIHCYSFDLNADVEERLLSDPIVVKRNSGKMAKMEQSKWNHWMKKNKIIVKWASNHDFRFNTMI